MAHAKYNPAGGNNWRKKKMKKLSGGPKSKPGAKFSQPWICPNPECHPEGTNGSIS